MRTRRWIKSVVGTLCAALPLAGAATAQGYANHIGVFGGGAFQDHDEAFALGIDFVHRLPAVGGLFGVGALGQVAFFDDHDAWVAMGTLSLHPFAGLKLLAGPGFQVKGSDADLLMRLGGGYDFAFGPIQLTPNFNVDFVDDEEVYVAGVTLGFGF